MRDAGTFNSLGGSIVPEQSVEPGGKVTQPDDPTRTSYDFGGWYTDANYTTAWNFAGDIVTGNITLYAKWMHVSVTGAEESIASNLNIYPNPFTGEVRITGAVVETGRAPSLQVRIINAAGVVVHTQIITNPDETIRLEHLPAGVYFFVFEKEGQVKTVKMVKE